MYDAAHRSCLFIVRHAGRVPAPLLVAKHIHQADGRQVRNNGRALLRRAAIEQLPTVKLLVRDSGDGRVAPVLPAKEVDAVSERLQPHKERAHEPMEAASGRRGHHWRQLARVTCCDEEPAARGDDWQKRQWLHHLAGLVQDEHLKAAPLHHRQGSGAAGDAHHLGRAEACLPGLGAALQAKLLDFSPDEGGLAASSGSQHLLELRLGVVPPLAIRGVHGVPQQRLV
mmetsp:Transcript_3563/g.10230  ORF Transcript_3563/g.10230 Transcript_3563/m.10230 type:complete len:227 (+) Transcript_3563:474-1154(+)